MKVIAETRRVHEIWYLRFYFFLTTKTFHTKKYVTEQE
jgi:hypothetical protein